MAEKRIFINNEPTHFWIEDTGRLRNERTNRWLKGGINKGYHFYSLHFRGKQYVKYTHRTVAEYFLPNPNNLPIVHHKDGNKLNNMFTNLEWISIEDHQLTINKIRTGKQISSRTYIQNLEDYGEIAQFRQSPYYLTKTGKVLNLSKKIELKQEKTGNYFRFTGQYNLKGKHFLVHRAVWEAFNGAIPEGMDIDHIDNDPSNNCLNNLQCITHKENLKKREFDKTYLPNNFYRGE